MEDTYVFINGNLVSKATASVSSADLALLRGYGVFDFFRVIQGKPLFFDAHWERLQHSSTYMHLQIPFSKDALLQMIAALYEKMPYPEAGLRVTLTGGNSEDGYSIAASPNSIVTLQPQAPLPVLHTKTMALKTHYYVRPMPEAKTIDYSMGIWLQPQLKAEGFDDALYTFKGTVSECPRANVFIVNEDGVLVTPSVHILKGITRMRVLALAEGLLPVEERLLDIPEIYAAKEVFITSSTKGILPVHKVDHQEYEVNLTDSVTSALYKKLLEV